MKNSLLSLEARRAIRDKRQEIADRRRLAKTAEANRRRHDDAVRQAEGNCLYAQLGAATTVLPREHTPVPYPWSRVEMVVFSITTLVAGLFALLFGSTSNGLIGAAVGAGALLLARRLAGSTLKTGAQPKVKLLYGVIGACACGYGFVVSLALNGWFTGLAFVVAAALMSAAAMAFSSPALSTAMEVWRREELWQRHASFEREAEVHQAHATRLRDAVSPKR